MNKEDALDNIMPLITNYLLPYGGKQLNRAYEGAKAIYKGGSYTDNGALRFAVDSEDKWESARAVTFGPYTTKAGQKYLENGTPQPLSSKNTLIYDYFTKTKKLGKQYTFDMLKGLTEYRKQRAKEEKKEKYQLKESDLRKYFSNSHFTYEIRREFVKLLSRSEKEFIE